VALLLLEPVRLEPKRLRVLCHGAHYVFGHAVGNLGLDLEPDLDLAAD